MSVAISFLCPLQNLFRLVLAFRQADDQKQDAGDRLARAIIRAEPPDHPFIALLSLHASTRNMWGFVPTRRASLRPKARGKTFSNIKDNV